MSSTLQGITALVAISSLILAITAYRKFLSNKLKEKQLETVCNLIKSIHDSYNIVWFNDLEGGSKAWHFTIFDIAGYDKFDEFENFYTFAQEDAKKFSDVVDWSFFSYYNDPLMPKAIANKIKKFNVWDWNATEYEKIRNQRCIILGKKGMIDSKTRLMYYSDKKTAKEFRQLCIDLRESILLWLKDYGIEDLNLSLSHHNLSKIKE